MTIKEIRKELKWTQKEMSENTGIPKRTIEDWESEKRKPPQYILNMLECIFIYHSGCGYKNHL